MSISAEDLKLTQKYYEKVKELSGSSSSGRDADVILSLIESINYLSDELAEAQAQVEGLVGALEDIKQKAWALSHTFNNQHRAEMKDIEAQCTKAISTLPADWLAQAQRREAVVRAAEKFWNHWREFRGSVPITGEMVILEAEDIQFLETVEAYQKGGA